MKVLAEKGQSRREIARVLGLDESTVRYHLKRMAEGAVDGRSRQRQGAEAWAAEIAEYLKYRKGGALNLAALHAWLREEHGYRGSLRSLQRYYRRRYPTPRKRARRRVETPPGAQAQVDWAERRSRYWRRCHSCPSRSIWRTRDASPRTARLRSRGGATRCRSGTWGAWWRYAGAPVWSRW